MIKDIRQYWHCARCIREVPKGQSPESWARLSVGITKRGFQVWCVRHDCNVVAIDLRGQVVGYDNTGNKEETH